MDVPMLHMPSRQMPWNIRLLICNLTLTAFLSLIVIIMLTKVVPIVPDLMRVLKVVDDTLADVNIMLPEMNNTLTDMHQVLPGIRRTIYYTENLCRHTPGCY